MMVYDPALTLKCHLVLDKTLEDVTPVVKSELFSRMLIISYQLVI